MELIINRKNMKFLDLANSGLQTIATALIVGGGYLIFESGKLVEGIALAVLGFIAYVLYEKFPSKPSNGQ